MFPHDCPFCMVTKRGYGFKKKEEKKKEKEKEKPKGFCRLCFIPACQLNHARKRSDGCVYGLWHMLSLFLWDSDLFLSACIREDYPTF